MEIKRLNPNGRVEFYWLRLVAVVMMFAACTAIGDSHAQELSPPNLPPSPTLPLQKTIEFGGSRFELRGRGYVLASAIWKWSLTETTKAIDVCWETVDSEFVDERLAVEAAVRGSWEKHSAVIFRGWKKCGPNPAGIRIGIKDTGPRTRGLGKKLKKKQNGVLLNFTFASWGAKCKESEVRRSLCIKSIAVHEFGHVLAIAHEHNRPDTPGECMAEPGEVITGDTILTPWDPMSVMNYCNPEHNNNGVLSAGDIATVQTMYGKP
jgi:hypothetical protein